MAKDKDERPPADYEVGYRKPPAKTRFKPGVSGNPHGRPKGASNFSTILDQELGIKRSITEQGRPKTVTNRRVIVKQLVNKAASGDIKSIALLLNEVRPMEAAPSQAPAAPALLRAEDQRVMDNFVRRIRAARPAEEESPPGTESSLDEGSGEDGDDNA